MIFWRAYNNQIYTVGDVENLGFPSSDASYIPDEYLAGREFIIMRTCFGLGDWGIISAMPRKLKEKYPDCKVYIPSPLLLERMFGSLKSNWDSWDNPYNVVHSVFDNNPYVDGFIDSFEGDVFHDHYRIWDSPKEHIPLVEQMLKFWQFIDVSDTSPEIYWSDAEKKLGDSIIKYHTSDSKYGTLLLSNRFNGDGMDKIQLYIDTYDLPLYYWISGDYGLDFKRALDMRHINIRIQLYIKSKATFNVGNQTGVNDTIAGYAPTYTVARDGLGSNIIRKQVYL